MEIKIILINLILLLLLVLFWPHKELIIGSSSGRIFALKDFKYEVDTLETYKKIKKYSDDIVLTTNKAEDGEVFYTVGHNGYRVFRYTLDDSLVRERIYPVIASLYSKKLENALVIGIATGVSVSAAADIYENVDAVDINEIFINEQENFYHINDRIDDKKNINKILADGFLYSFYTKKKYDFVFQGVSQLIYYPSSKLYTVDFFKIISSKLSKNGVFLLWYDGRVSPKGVNILYSSLDSVFKDCKQFFLAVEYITVMCSNEKLIKNNLVKRKSKFVGFLYDFVDLLELNIKYKNIETLATLDKSELLYNSYVVYNEPNLSLSSLFEQASDVLKHCDKIDERIISKLLCAEFKEYFNLKN